MICYFSWIFEDVVGFIDFFELISVMRMQIRMVLFCQFVVSCLDVLLAGFSIHPKDVVVALDGTAETTQVYCDYSPHLKLISASIIHH